MWRDIDRLVRRAVAEGVKFFRIGIAPYQFNFDTEELLERGYTAFFVPGGGIVVTTPDTLPAVAVQHTIDEGSEGAVQAGAGGD